MSKDFEKQILAEHFRQNQKLDPFVFVTPEVTQYLSLLNLALTGKFVLSFLASSVLVAPFQTVATSLQLSVEKHKNIYQTKQARSKQLAMLNTQMTVHDKRKFQLMIRAGGKTTPYVAPVYNGYRQAYEGIKSQGWRAFYKGLGFRLFASAFYFYPFTINSLLIDNVDVEKGVLYQNLKLFSYCLFLDLAMNPFHLLENRYILQNRLPQFRVIRDPVKSIQKTMRYGQAWKGLGFHLINNSVGFFTRFPLYLSMIAGQGINPLLYGSYLVGELITYPFSTAFKRLQCQTERHAGMIPIRYSGLFHALRVMVYEQGARGLWRGFPIHAVLNLIRLKLTDILTKQRPTKE